MKWKKKRNGKKNETEEKNHTSWTTMNHYSDVSATIFENELERVFLNFLLLYGSYIFRGKSSTIVALSNGLPFRATTISLAVAINGLVNFVRRIAGVSSKVMNVVSFGR